ncbi:(d)CMP kinase [Aerococcaceae bacterium DSM 109653]|uniref:Cytidylate kinase n=2 Tax=Fundicoccus ignavus TaxID=2664442 RepID=A0A844BX61_9LACT|nr:(d)CMP kinase [Fundicoccus ignavus]MRJ46548.1 (d)CMP kinase [Fundicoccus ignavus]
MKMTITIAIDGPAASGKSTIAKQIAKKLNITYIDTGAMYRGVTLAILKRGIEVENVQEIRNILNNIELDFNFVNGVQHLFLDGQDAEEEIRSIEVSQNVSAVSALDFVREKLVDLQRKMAEKQSVVMDGRDIGTVVLPKADFKFFFIASPEIRAQRRYDENIARGINTQTFEELKQDIIRRDEYDSTREHSPLKQADDAIAVDTGLLSIEENVEYVLSLIQKTN